MYVDDWRLSEPDATPQCWQGMRTRCGKVIPPTVVFRSRPMTSRTSSLLRWNVICIYLHFRWPGEIKCLRRCSYLQTWTSREALGGKEMHRSTWSQRMNPPLCKHTNTSLQSKQVGPNTAQARPISLLVYWKRLADQVLFSSLTRDKL